VLHSTTSSRSKLQEKKAAKDYNGRTTPGSGATWHHKADVRSDKYLVECKTTVKSSYSLKATDVKKLLDQALTENRTGLFEIEFSELGLTCVVMDKEDFIGTET
jgi:hypothetical protein